ncbi:MAG: hypothetical protein ABI297_06770 [Ginsengibacter sp.]
MKKIYRCLFICATFFSVLSNVKAQDSTKNAGEDKSYFEGD